MKKDNKNEQNNNQIDIDMNDIKTKFIETIRNYNVCNEELIDFLTEHGLFEAPASTMKSLHNAYPGGLIDHIFKVTSYAIKINDGLPEKMKQTKDSLVKVSFLHSIGKVGLYKTCTSEWHRKNLGKMYEFNEDITSMSVGERSIYYILKTKNFNILTSEEYQAIINFDKNNDDKAAEWHTETLGEILKIAIKLAILEEKLNTYE